MERILVVKLNAIGDVLFATPLVQALRARWPSARIDWLVGRHAAAILDGHPSVTRTLLYDGPWSASKSAAAVETLALLPRLRAARYDAAFCLHRSRFAGWLVRCSGARVRVGFRDTPGMSVTAPFDASRHETERYLDLLRALGHAVTNPGMCVGWTPAAAAQAEALLPTSLGPRPWVGLAPGGGRNPGTEMLIKRWPAERCAELATRVPGTVVVCGSPDEADLCAQVAAARPGAVDLCGRTRLAQLPALLARLDCCVANDSGPLHIAAAAGTPTVALFGPTDPRLVAPLGPAHVHLWRPPDCAPCYRPDNAREHRVWHCARSGDELRCLRDIGVDEVLAAITAAVAQRRA